VKNKRLFDIINTLNIVLWITFFTYRIWGLYRETYTSYEHNEGLLIIFGIFIIIVILFSFFCYKLSKTFKTALPLSDSSRLIGPIIVVLFTLLTIIFDWMSISNFKYYFTGRLPGYNWIFINLVLLALSITSTYLCIVYWVIRRGVQKQLTGIIAGLGEEENS
jgi:hypothetical protein